MRIGEKTRFARIRPSASKIGIFFDSRESAKRQCANLLPSNSEKLIVLTACAGKRHCDSNGDLNRGSNHKSGDLKVRFEPAGDSDLGEILAIWAPRFQITSDLRFVIWST